MIEMIEVTKFDFSRFTVSHLFVNIVLCFHVRNCCYSAIRVAAQWYQTHLGGSARVLLITNDKENKRKAIEEGISAETGVYIYVLSTSFEFDSLLILMC